MLEDIPTTIKFKDNDGGELDQSDDGDSVSFVEMSEETFKNLILKFGKKSTRS